MADQLGLRKDGQFKAVSSVPSINLTPVGNAKVPIPYPVVSDLGDSLGVVPNVRANGNPVYTLDQSSQPMCKGDSDGSDKGVSSGTVNGEVKPDEASTTVRAGGKFWVRAGNRCRMQGGQCIGTYLAPPAPSGSIAGGSPSQTTNPPVRPEGPSQKQKAARKRAPRKEPEPPKAPQPAQPPVQRWEAPPPDGIWGKMKALWRKAVKLRDDVNERIADFTERRDSNWAGLGRIRASEREGAISAIEKTDSWKANELRAHFRFMEQAQMYDFSGGGGVLKVVKAARVGLRGRKLSQVLTPLKKKAAQRMPPVRETEKPLAATPTVTKGTGSIPNPGGGVKIIGKDFPNFESGQDLARHLKYCKKYGKVEVKLLKDGRIRYYGKTAPAQNPGEMAGRRMVKEFNPITGKSRSWHETLDHNGRIRQVRPGGSCDEKFHYVFDKNGKFRGSR